MSKIPTTEESTAVTPVVDAADEQVVEESATEVAKVRKGLPAWDVTGASDPTIKNK